LLIMHSFFFLSLHFDDVVKTVNLQLAIGIELR
jgi:hypothetical protein